MFKFLFRNKPVEVVKETQRETITRALGEVNEVLALMGQKPKVTVNLESGLIELDLPEQMPDEALALPKPAKEQETPTKSDTEEAKPEEEPAKTAA